VKFIEGEWANVALRLSRVGKNVPVAGAPKAAPAPSAAPVRSAPVNAGLDDASKCRACGAAKGTGKFCGNCGELISTTVNSIV